MVNCIPKKYKSYRIKLVNSKNFVADWDRNKKIIYINKHYVKKPKVSCGDIKAVLEHEIEERNKYLKGYPMILAHCIASQKERNVLKKYNLKYPGHQKEIINTYRYKATDDAPYYEIKCKNI